MQAKSFFLLAYASTFLQVAVSRPTKTFTPAFSRGSEKWRMEILTLDGQGAMSTSSAIATLEERLEEHWNLTRDGLLGYQRCVEWAHCYDTHLAYDFLDDREPFDLDFGRFRLTASRAETADRTQTVDIDEGLLIYYGMLQWLRLWRDEGLVQAASFKLTSEHRGPRIAQGSFGLPLRQIVAFSSNETSNIKEISNAKAESINLNATDSRNIALGIDPLPRSPWGFKRKINDSDDLNGEIAHEISNFRGSLPLQAVSDTLWDCFIYVILHFFQSGEDRPVDEARSSNWMCGLNPKGPLLKFATQPAIPDAFDRLSSYEYQMIISALMTFYGIYEGHGLRWGPYVDYKGRWDSEDPELDEEDQRHALISASFSRAGSLGAADNDTQVPANDTTRTLQSDTLPTAARLK